MSVWLIEVSSGGERWIPMYQPCYTKREAEQKLARKPKHSGLRIRQYRRVETPEEQEFDRNLEEQTYE